MKNMNKENEFIEKIFDKALLSKTTSVRKQYRARIKQFFNLIGEDASTYCKSNPDYEEDIQSFYESKTDKGGSEQQLSKNAIYLFLKTQDKSIKTLDIWENINRRLKGKKQQIILDAMTPNKLKRILNYADIRTKSAILLSTSSGVRLETVVGLEFGDINLNRTPTQITVRKEINKGKKNSYVTFCTPEATECLKEWLRVRDKFSSECRKSLNFHRYKDRLPNLEKDKRIFPIIDSRIRSKFNVACDRAGFNEKVKINMKYTDKNGKTQQRERRTLTFHSLRSYFRTYMQERDLAEFCMGHSDINNRYYRRPLDEIAQEYLNHCTNLQVFDREADITGVHEQLAVKETEIQELKEKVKDVDDMKMQLLELRLTIQELKNGKD